ncbi:CD275 [Mytilus edulis]|uniref:ICOSLG n=1 Tax=Mytilus edulis TaxID=6550 RepID=A0A8S3UUY3_MYTED|nr:CD275 [Mytilus edulis]
MIIFEGGTDTCIYAESGATTVLKCPITKNVDTMQWSYTNKSSKVVISDNNVTNPTWEEKSKFMVVVNILDELYELSITNLSKSDEKTYICWTQNKTFNTTSTNGNSSVKQIKFTLYLKKRPSQLLLADPVLNNTIEWVENLEITISCSSVDGVPKPNVFWIYHPDIFVTESNDIGWSNITFTPTRHYNEQVYICKAEYDMLPISLNETVILNVLYKPVITITRWPKGVIF